MIFLSNSAKESGILRNEKGILAKIGANFLLSNGKLHIEAKRAYIAIENKLPDIRKVEERGRLEVERYGKPKKATLREMISGWSCLCEEVRTGMERGAAAFKAVGH